MAKVVILGAGLGGLIAAFEIKKTLGDQHDVAIISETDYYQFQPQTLGCSWDGANARM